MEAEIDFELTVRPVTDRQRDYAFRMVSWLYERPNPLAGHYETDVESCHDGEEMSALITAMRAEMGLED